ncbi:MAG: DUF192 domain-containing protein [Opitutales bacterium]|jgi:uncharacterized membrane protein (UPF0127 family)
MRFLWAFLALALLSACGGEKVPAPAADGEPFTRAYQLKLDGKVLLARIAVTEMEKTQGLMGVSPSSDEGMLFVYTTNTHARFWMKDTPADLDIAFFDREGRLLKVATMRAYDTEVTDSGSDRVRFALEMRAGWFSQQGMREGAKLDLYSVVNALRARGFNPTKLGL